MRVFGKSLIPALFLLSTMVMPNLALASTTVDFTNLGGTLSGSNSGMSLSGSTLIAISGLNGNGLMTGDLGTVSFTTGSLINGSMQTGGTFYDGTFTVDGNGASPIGSGVLFSGQFTGNVTWTLITLANGTHNYTLTGIVTGTISGVNVSGVSVQLTVNTGKGYFNGSAPLSSGDTSLSSATVPEPSTLAFFGTGFVGLAGIVRRKARQSSGQKS